MKQYSERVYVMVNTDFDPTGYMMPRSIKWSDGRVFTIEAVRDFRPASALENGRSGDCYTVVIKGEEKLLFLKKPVNCLRPVLEDGLLKELFLSENK